MNILKGVKALFPDVVGFKLPGPEIFLPLFHFSGNATAVEVKEYAEQYETC